MPAVRVGFQQRDARRRGASAGLEHYDGDFTALKRTIQAVQERDRHRIDAQSGCSGDQRQQASEPADRKHREDMPVFSITDRRKRVRNLARGPRVSRTVFAANSPYDSIEIRGTAERIEEPDKRLSHKYLASIRLTNRRRRRG